MPKPAFVLEEPRGEKAAFYADGRDATKQTSIFD